MHYLLNNIDRKTGSRPDRSELNSRSLNIINAGADPFAGVLAAAFFYLLHNQCALRKATKEIREMFSTPSEICSGPKLNSCVYLQACIQETLRLAPPAPSHLPREVLPGDIDVYGTTFLVVCTSRESVELAHWTFCPFSLGICRCIGKNVEYLELKLVLAHILHRFDMRLAATDMNLGGGNPDLEGERHRLDEFQLVDYIGVARNGPHRRRICG
ncbi:cytochrome P450 [Cenococcum geophilum 1.58]|uniref:cytochrome P450 n=1 Tax=Cenococcum geophilum 1.58 TaxID=794803 RepID=UPI00358E264B|nr:cytochrome P450 [Cenococcum geophilum 1.58]